ncbi:hypothetical protein AHiyo8_14640 [Arthrobacter sp. Hiyo8]|nr:hypothetical protein AHiyo8_14640 [Arthrobacter sp. Hiyo8]
MWESPARAPAQPRSSDLEQLGFLALEELVDTVDVCLGDSVEFLFTAGTLVFAGFAVLDELVQGVLGLAPDASDGNLCVLTLAFDDLDVFLAAFLGELRDGDPDDVAVVGRIGADLGVAQGLSISRIEVLSKGVIRMVLASGIAKEASCCSGVGVP